MVTAADILRSFSGHSCRRTYHREPRAFPVLIQRGSGHTLVVTGVEKVHRDDVETAVTAGPSGHLEKRQHRLVIAITPRVSGHLYIRRQRWSLSSHPGFLNTCKYGDKDGLCHYTQGFWTPVNTATKMVIVITPRVSEHL